MGSLIEDKIYPVSEGEATYCLREAWFKIYNQYPSVNSLAILWAQWTLETGRGSFSHCYNAGNIKRSSDEDYCMFRCNEILAGKVVWFDPPHKQTWFRAYPSALEGMYDYVKFLSQRTRYQNAWKAVQAGDPTDYSHQLKISGYYTASESLYTKGVVSLTNEFKKKSEQLLAWKPKEDERRSQLPTSVGEEPLPLPPLIPLDLSTLEYHPDQESPKNIEIPNQRWFIALINAILELFKSSR